MVDVDPVILVGKVALQLVPSLSLIVIEMLMILTTTMGHLAVDSKLVVDPLKPPENHPNSILNQMSKNMISKVIFQIFQLEITEPVVVASS